MVAIATCDTGCVFTHGYKMSTSHLCTLRFCFRGNQLPSYKAPAKPSWIETESHALSSAWPQAFHSFCIQLVFRWHVYLPTCKLHGDRSSVYLSCSSWDIAHSLWALKWTHNKCSRILKASPLLPWMYCFYNFTSLHDIPIVIVDKGFGD